jgi:hypothetical protein
MADVKYFEFYFRGAFKYIIEAKDRDDAFTQAMEQHDYDEIDLEEVTQGEAYDYGLSL